jgi:hypothetical protein
MPRLFGGIYRVHLEGREISPTRNQQVKIASKASRDVHFYRKRESAQGGVTAALNLTAVGMKCNRQRICMI